MQDAPSGFARALADRYRLDGEIGQGGMATVYRARDLRHERDVAIKVLKPELGAVLGVDRFLSEIRVTANLQHPNLLPLFDSGEASGLLYYVMPFVEGETLRARLDREGQLPIDEALRITRSMAGALEYAHQRGVIHRDLKPENVLLQAGQPVIADFGIALAVAQAGGQRVTQTGLSLGTPQYMSPEQATGDKQLDARTDIYALGVITYEMLAGEPPHIGQSAQAIIAKLMTEEARPLTVLRKSVPPAVDAAVRRALEKIPADRFPSAGVFASALGDGTVSAERYYAVPPRERRGVTAALVAVTLVMTAVAGWALTAGRTASGGTARPLVRFAVPATLLRHGAGLSGTSLGLLALSPDGDRIVFTKSDTLAGDSLVSRLWVRRLGDERSVPLPGTENAWNPVFSPDGEWVAYSSPAGLSRVRLAGGEPQRIIDASRTCCIAWAAADTLIFVDSVYRLRAVGAAGGSAVPLDVRFDDLSVSPRIYQPVVLPSGLLLFHARVSQDPDSTVLYRLDRRTGKATRVLANAADPKLFGGDYLLFLRRGTLMAARFDASEATVLGEPVRVVENVMQALINPGTYADRGIGQYAVSGAGDLVYVEGSEAVGEFNDLVLARPGGRVDTLMLGIPNIYVPRVSPDGRKIAFHANVSSTSATRAIFVLDLQRRVTTRLVEGGFINQRPQWSTDGREIAFESDREGGVSAAYVVAADGSTPPKRVVAPDSDSSLALMAWSSDRVFAGQSRGDIWVAREGESPRPFFTSPEAESFATFSPDGRWLAYAATVGGRNEVFVRPFPGPGPAVRVSADGGTSPAWSRDGRALYYFTSGTPAAVLRVPVNTAGGFAVGQPTEVLPAWPYGTASPNRRYDVMPDGSLLGVSASAQQSRIRDRSAAEFHVVLNFLAEIRARLP